MLVPRESPSYVVPPGLLLPPHISIPISHLNLDSSSQQQHRAAARKMSADDDSSDLSSLSSLSPAPSDIELDAPADLEAPKPKPKKGIQKYFSTVAEQPPKEPTPPPRKRSPSPPHEYVLADNPDIAVCARISIFIHFSKGNGLARVATFATRPGRVLDVKGSR